MKPSFFNYAILFVFMGVFGYFLFGPGQYLDTKLGFYEKESPYKYKTYDGESSIGEIKVIDQDMKSVTLEVEYFYNGRYGQFINIHVKPDSRFPDSKKEIIDRQFYVSKVKSGRDKVKVSIPRFRNVHSPYVTNGIEVAMIKRQGRKYISKTFANKIEWPAYSLAKDEEFLNKDRAHLVDEARLVIDTQNRRYYKKARSQLQKVLLATPDYHPAYLLMARLELVEDCANSDCKKERYKKGEDLILQALRVSPEDQDAHILMGLLQTKMGNMEKAKTHLDKAAESEIKNYRYFYNYALYYEKLGDRRKMLEYYHKVADKKPVGDKNDRVIRTAKEELFYQYTKSGELEKADEVFLSYLDSFPEKVCRKADYANFLLTRMGDIDKAEAYIMDIADGHCLRINYVKHMMAKVLYTRWHQEKPGSSKKAELLSKAKVAMPIGSQIIADLANSKYTVDVIKSFLVEGVDIDVTDSRGRTALSLSVQDQKYRAVKNLLQYGADPNKVLGIDEWTPLMLAAMTGDSKLVTILLQNGADRNKLSRSGLSASNIAKQYGFSELIPLLAGSDA